MRQELVGAQFSQQQQINLTQLPKNVTDILAGTPELNKEDMLFQEEVQGKYLKQKNHEPWERYREYAVTAEPGRKYGDEDQDAADSYLKTSKDNKRRIVEVEYVAPRSRTQRGELFLSGSETGAVAGAGLPSLHHRDD
jgi:hypothetical protein